MGWIGLSDKTENSFQLEGVNDEDGIPTHLTMSDGNLLCGSIMFEAKPSNTIEPQTLLTLETEETHEPMFMIRNMVGSGLVMVDNLGDEPQHVALPLPEEAQGDLLRITYSWDVTTATAQITCERPDCDQTHSVTIANPNPVPINALLRLSLGFKIGTLPSNIEYVAISSQPEPVGPMPGLGKFSPILTTQGYTDVQRLKRGDLVMNAQGDAVPVLEAVHRSVPALGSFRPIRLRRPYYNLMQDIIVSRHQRLVISGSQVEYMFPTDTVLAPAGNLMQMAAAQFADTGKFVSYYQLLLPEHDSISVAGCLTESLYIGRMRRKPEALNTSILQHMNRSTMPEHAKPSNPVLKDYEAVALAAARVA